MQFVGEHRYLPIASCCDGLKRAYLEAHTTAPALQNAPAPAPAPANADSPADSEAAPGPLAAPANEDPPADSEAAPDPLAAPTTSLEMAAKLGHVDVLRTLYSGSRTEPAASERMVLRAAEGGQLSVLEWLSKRQSPDQWGTRLFNLVAGSGSVELLAELRRGKFSSDASRDIAANYEEDHRKGGLQGRGGLVPEQLQLEVRVTVERRDAQLQVLS
ncbi:hypothetical protein JKP88DRAFT_352863 [Tribonema minus]|uniref:Ankyrin repeat domain-containing protein n=1 Tax=Tribonema minus TaxID=303371 RepID=A0A835ZA64_9STRA|nr:hypothetical protein JKP88DRAFT_352863 [Tribonema minus]